MSSLDRGKKTGLGRGLGSLLGDGLSDELETKPALRNKTVGTSLPKDKEIRKSEIQVKNESEKIQTPVRQKIPDDARVWKIDLEKIQPNVKQPRRFFDKEKLTELANSIKSHGLLQPITVRRIEGGNFEIVAGERRWRAAQIAELGQIPAIIKELEDQKSLELALIENIQRADLNPIEEAEAYERLIDEYSLTQQQVSEKVGKDRASVSNMIRLLSLEKEVRKLVAEGTLTIGHAKVLLSVSDLKFQRKLAYKAVNRKLSVRQLEKLIKSQEEESNTSRTVEVDVTQKLVMGLKDELQKRLGRKVTIDYNNKKGKIGIHFYSDDELSEVVERLKSAWNTSAR